MKRLGPVLGLLLARVLVWGACDRAAPTLAGDRAVLVPQPALGDEIVATVGTVPIYVSAVRAQAEAAHCGARAALDALISTEALAQAALDRGLDRDADVRLAAKQAEVRRLLHGAFEAEASPARIPDADYQQLYETNQLRFDHGEIAEVWHLIAAAPTAAGAAAREAARQRLASLQARAEAATTDEAFAALADPSGQPAVRAEHLSFPRHGVVEESFAAAAFQLTRPGQLSGVVETSYGAHLIRLVQRLPARHVPLADARAEMEAPLLLAFRRREFVTWMRDLDEHHHVEIHAERLDPLEGRP